TMYGLGLTEAFAPAGELQRKSAQKSLHAELNANFESGRAEMEKELSRLSDQLRALDPTLEEAAKRAASKIMYQLSRLKGRAGKAEARKSSDVARHASAISNSLYPHKDLQERGVAGISVVGRQGTG